MIKGINISKSFGNKKVLNKVNIKIKQGEAVVVMGPSGSGKTTLLRSLALLDKPDSGKVVVDDKEFVFPNDSDFKKPYPKVTVVYQQLFLWPHLTNRENITLAVENTDYATQLDELIDYLGMGKFIDNYPNQSSVGQKQRVAIARAILRNPAILILDEPTSALDAESEHFITNSLEELMRGRTTFIIAHRLSTIFALIEAHLKRLGKNGLLPAGVVISGGGSGVTTVEDIARVVLKIPSKKASLMVEGKSKVKNSTWAVAFGLCIWGLTNDIESSSFSTIKENASGFITWLKQFLP